MKPNLYPIIALIFIALSIYLSILIKNKNQHIAERERTINTQNQLMDDYKYRIALLQESILLNITDSPRKTIDKENFSWFSESDLMFLYLKAHA